MASAPPTIFSPPRRAAAARRALRLQETPDAGRFVLEDMAQDVLERLAFLRHDPARSLVAGDLTGQLVRALAARGGEVIEAPAELDEERPYAQGGFDLVASFARLDTVNDLPGALIHIRKALAAGGLFFGSLLGHGSLPALRRILLAADGEQPAARLHPQIDIVAATTLMQRAGFARQVVDSHALHASYRSFEQLVADLRAQGLRNVLADPPPTLTRAALARAHAAFAELADDDGRLRETFEILTLTGWR